MWQAIWFDSKSTISTRTHSGASCKTEGCAAAYSPHLELSTDSIPDLNWGEKQAILMNPTSGLTVSHIRIYTYTHIVALDVELATEKLRLRRKLSSVAVLSHMIMSVLTEWRTLIVVDEAHRGIPDDGEWIKHSRPLLLGQERPQQACRTPARASMHGVPRRPLLSLSFFSCRRNSHSVHVCTHVFHCLNLGRFEQPP